MPGQCACEPYRHRRVLPGPPETHRLPIIVHLWVFDIEALARLFLALEGKRCFPSIEHFCEACRVGGVLYGLLPVSEQAGVSHSNPAHAVNARWMGRNTCDVPKVPGSTAEIELARAYRETKRADLCRIVEAVAAAKNEKRPLRELAPVFVAGLEKWLECLIRALPDAGLATLCKNQDELPVRGVSVLRDALPRLSRFAYDTRRATLSEAWKRYGFDVNLWMRLDVHPRSWTAAPYVTRAMVKRVLRRVK